jgi:AcrR family transcriptional regulator
MASEGLKRLLANTGAMGAILPMANRAVREDIAVLRRRPRRESARDVVEAIVTGASRILASDGYAAMTTNRISEVAGVSIGSFYQYFSAKHSVIAEIAKRLEHGAIALLSTQLADAIDIPLRIVTRSFIQGFASRRFGDLKLRRELLRHVPRQWTEDTSIEVDRGAQVCLTEHLSRRSDIRAGDKDLMAFILVHAVEGVVEAAVLSRPELIDSEAFLDELTELMVRFLERNGINV